MTTRTTISWTNMTWNPLRGCSRISPGCVNCYAERHAARFSNEGAPFEGYAERTSSGPRWMRDEDGKARVDLMEHILDAPTRIRKPHRIFVNSMSDLFHEVLAGGVIERIFAVMLYAAPHHKYQVLTKRANRMLSWSESYTRKGKDPIPVHVQMGVSIENQKVAEERIPMLLATAARFRWLSVEPLLEGVHIRAPWLKRLDWVVVGGESGPGARPFDLKWARDVVKQCRSAGVPVFVKQMGARPFDGVRRDVAAMKLNFPGDLAAKETLRFENRKGEDPNEWPADLRVREWPKEAA